MAVKETWKTPLKEMDKCEKRDYIKDLFRKGDWELLQNCTEVTNEVLENIYPEAVITKRQLPGFLLECAKENLPGAKELLRKLNA